MAQDYPVVTLLLCSVKLSCALLMVMFAMKFSLAGYK